MAGTRPQPRSTRDDEIRMTSPEESAVISGANKPASELCCEGRGNTS